jgi:predicted Rossmann fold nucleotide-binding protein DprA/Smf involved in DNA uptake
MTGAHFRPGVNDIGITSKNRHLALFCSRRCPGSIILRAHDLAVALRDVGVPVIGGFQTPMEREMLAVLLRGSQPVVVVDARNARKRLPPDWRLPYDERRLQILSPFDVDRPTSQTADERNRLVVSLADRVLIVHAAAGSRTEALARDVASSGKPLFTIETDDDSNVNLIEFGAVPVGTRSATWPSELTTETVNRYPFDVASSSNNCVG